MLVRIDFSRRMWYISKDEERSACMEELKSVIARNIASLRQKAGLTQLELAEKLHYSDKAVSKWERGESLPDVGVLKQIADLFHVTLDSLLQTEAAASPPEIPGASRHTRRLIVAITLTGVLALAFITFLVLKSWLVMVYMLPVAAVVWLVFNTLWFNRRWNYAIISALMWSALLCLCVTFAAFSLPKWEMLLPGLPGQLIIWLCSRFARPKADTNERGSRI